MSRSRWPRHKQGGQHGQRLCSRCYRRMGHRERGRTELCRKCHAAFAAEKDAKE